MKFYFFIFSSFVFSVSGVFFGIKLNEVPETKKMLHKKGVVLSVARYKACFNIELEQDRNQYSVRSYVPGYDEIFDKVNMIGADDYLDILAYQDFWERDGNLTVVGLSINNVVVYDTETFMDGRRTESYYGFGIGVFMLLIFLLLMYLYLHRHTFKQAQDQQQ